MAFPKCPSSALPSSEGHTVDLLFRVFVQTQA